METKKEESKQVAINVNVPEHLRAATFANIVNVTTTATGEVFIDFASVHPNERTDTSLGGTLVARVILPMNVARDLQLIFNAHLGKPKKE